MPLTIWVEAPPGAPAPPPAGSPPRATSPTSRPSRSGARRRCRRSRCSTCWRGSAAGRGRRRCCAATARAPSSAAAARSSARAAVCRPSAYGRAHSFTDCVRGVFHPSWHIVRWWCECVCVARRSPPLCVRTHVCVDCVPVCARAHTGGEIDNEHELIVRANVPVLDERFAADVSRRRIASRRSFMTSRPPHIHTHGCKHPLIYRGAWARPR